VPEVAKSWQIVRRGECDTREFPWGEIRWLADEALGNSPEMTFGRVTIRAGKQSPPHRHANWWGLLFLLRGWLRHHFGPELAETKPGDLAIIPPGLGDLLSCDLVRQPTREVRANQPRKEF